MNANTRIASVLDRTMEAAEHASAARACLLAPRDREHSLTAVTNWAVDPGRPLRPWRAAASPAG